jgi:hypothetical protein
LNVNNAMLTRTAVFGAGAALCLGVSAPATAHTDTVSATPAHQTETAQPAKPTLAQEQAWVDRFVAQRQLRLQRFAAAIAADPRLTAGQQAAVAARIAAVRAALAALMAKVDAATSTEQVHAVVESALTALPHLAWPRFDARAQSGLRHRQAHKPATANVADAALQLASARQMTVHRSQGRPCHDGLGWDGFDGGRHADGQHADGQQADGHHGNYGGKHRR